MSINNFNRATKYLLAGKHKKALSFFKKQILEGESKELYLNMGNCYRFLNDDAEAVKCYEKSISPDITSITEGYLPEYALGLTNLGLMRYTVGDGAGAIEYYKRALKADPNYKDAAWNYANAYVRQGMTGYNIDWNLAWQLFEFRFNRTNPTVTDPTVPRWDGRSFVDKLIVTNEQGIGDKLMFARYFNNLKSKCNELYIQCDEKLNLFFEDNFKVLNSYASTIPGSVCIPTCSLASLYGDDGDEHWFKPKQQPYNFGEGKHIGIVWSGNPAHHNDTFRSTTIDKFERFKKYGTLYSLHPNNTPSNICKKLPINSWSDTISYILGLDLVVTIDTSIVHLAGTLGVPCVMIQPYKETDWRWGEDSIGTRNAWYKSVRVIRNKQNWDKAFSDAEIEVEKIVQNS